MTTAPMLCTVTDRATGRRCGLPATSVFVGMMTGDLFPECHLHAGDSRARGLAELDTTQVVTLRTATRRRYALVAMGFGFTGKVVGYSDDTGRIRARAAQQSHLRWGRVVDGRVTVKR